MNDKIEKQRMEMESLRSIVARVESDNTQLKLDNANLTLEVTQLKLDNSNLLSTVSRIDSENARLHTDLSLIQSSLSEIRGDLETLHPLPYARLKLSHCIKIQEACNDALNDFHTRYSTASINSDPSLFLQLQELNKALKKAWDARFAAAFLCEPPPTLPKVLWIMAKSGFTKEVIGCMNLNKATRSCKMLQPLMREVHDKRGMTQLNHFALRGMTASVKRMLSMKGIDVNSRVKDNATNTCLMSASCSGSVPVVEMLLNHGAHIEATAKNLATPVYFAAASNNIAVVNLLINRGANIEAKDVSGFTPLHIAAFHGRLNSVKFLIAKGANMNALTIDDSSALGIARRNEHVEIDEFLRSVGAFDDGFDGEEEEDEDEDLDDDEDEDDDGEE